MKSQVITIRRASILPEISCPDGEAASFANIPFLQPDSEDTAEPSTPDADPDSSIAAITRISLEQYPCGISLPANSIPIAIHAPTDSAPRRFLIALQQNNALCAIAIIKKNTSLQQDPAMPGVYNIAFWPKATLGNIRKAESFGNIILLLGERGFARLILNPATQTYALATTLPAAPQPFLSLSPATLSGYVNIAGQRPKTELAIPLPDSDTVSQEAIENWFNGIEASLTDANRKAVMKAMAEATKRYVEDAAKAGFFLTPPKAITSLSGYLPSQEAIAADSTPDSMAIAESFTWHAGILYLNVAFTMLPLQLTASLKGSPELTENENNTLWTQFFPTIDIALSREPARFSSNDNYSPIAMRRIADPSNPDASVSAFIYRAASATALMKATRDESEYIIAKQIPLENFISSTAIIPRPDYSQKNLPSFTPDYGDFSRFYPDEISSCDDGLILIGGSAEICTAAEVSDPSSFKKVSRANALMTPDLQCPLIYRDAAFIGDSQLFTTVQGSGSKTASGKRHPLQAFSADGVRVLNPNAEGGLLNAKIITKTPLLGSDTICPTDSGSVCATLRGIYFFPFSSGTPTILQNTQSVKHAISKGKSLRFNYLNKENAIFMLSDAGELSIFDLNDKKIYDCDDLLTYPAIAHEGELFTITQARELCRIGVGKYYVTETSNASNSTNPSDLQTISDANGGLGDSGDSGDSADTYALAATSSTSAATYADLNSRLLTRAIKLGDYFSRKRIHSVEALLHDESPADYDNSQSAIFITLEGSNSLGRSVNWEILTSGTAPLRALHVAPFRYFRLRASCDPAEVENLRLFRIKFDITD